MNHSVFLRLMSCQGCCFSLLTLPLIDAAGLLLEPGCKGEARVIVLSQFCPNFHEFSMFILVSSLIDHKAHTFFYSISKHFNL